MTNLDTLPPEILNLILSQFMPRDQELSIRRSYADNIGQVKRLSASVLGARCLRGLLLTNHNISTQVLDTIYGSNVFTFHDPWLIETFMVRIGRTNLDRIAHVQVQAGAMTKKHNDTTTTTLFSIISSHFQSLRTLRIVGVGRGKRNGSSFDPGLWLPSHLERLEFITSLPGSLSGAKVYCDVDENNTRLLCNGAVYRKDADEVEVNMQNARIEMKNADRMVKKRRADDLAKEPKVTTGATITVKAEEVRKRPKVKPTYAWKC